MAEAKKAKNLASILENLASQEGSGISRFVTKTEGEEDVMYAYFMKDPNVNFRHEGIEGKSPEVVYLAATDDDTTMEELDTTEKVLVYYSASGSGKTVELAASSVTRDADLTFLLKIEGDVSMEDAKRAQKNDPKKRSLLANRNELAFEKLWENVEHLIAKYDRAMTSILEGADADCLKIVVAIDEASSSPVLVRSIISDRDGAAAFLKQKIQGDTESKVVEILFSIAGTGVASQSIASDRGNFEHMRTSAMRSSYLYPTMALQDTPIHLIFPGDTAAVLVTKDVISKRLPVLYCMMENARMASIALKLLKDIAADEARRGRQLEEGKVLERIAKLFIASNGLKKLRRDYPRQRASAACAFAIMLFQCKAEDGKLVPRNDDDVERILRDYECGVELDPTVANMVIGGCQAQVRQQLIASFGLLEPHPINEIRKGHPVHQPYTMPASQQLIALHLLGIDLKLLVAANPFGFEVLSTHTMKAAIAASSVVAWEQRKSVADTLALVGCEVDENGTHRDAVRKWEELKELFVVPHRFEREGLQNWQQPEEFYKTITLNAELEIASGGRGVEPSLLIEKRYYELLKDANEEPPVKNWYPPMTAVNYGTSALADGFLTYLVAKRASDSTGLPVDISRYTAMNQAKDKLGNSGTPQGPLPMKKIANNAKRCDHGVLNGVFGERRLLFVSTPTRMKLFAAPGSKLKIERKWVPRVMQKCEILGDVMETLARQRCKDTTYCPGERDGAVSSF